MYTPQSNLQHFGATRMATPRPIQTEYEQLIANYWDTKTNDAINLFLGRKDNIIHHHFGLGELEMDIDQFSQAEVLDELHRLENQQTLLAIGMLRNVGRDSVILDAGSGRGGTAFMLHRLLGCRVVGVNTSGYQVNFSNDLAQTLGVSNHVEFFFDNMERMDRPDKSIDAVITNETTMYIKNLEKLFREFGRVLREGGTYVVATWCKNDAHKGEFSACTRIEDHYLVRLHYRSDYLRALVNTNFVPIEMRDFSAIAVPYWKLRMRCDHRTGIEPAFLEAYRNGEMVYCMLSAQLV